MKKISKSKKGFTLVEMVLVIAIIVILAVAMIGGVATYIKYANTAKSVLNSHKDEVEAGVAEIEANI